MNHPALLLLRHAESTWNAEGLWQGWADPPLSAQGERLSAEFADQIIPLGVSRIYSSDLERAMRTAEIIASTLGLPVPTVDSRWRERDVGQWTGLTDLQIEARWPGSLRSWRDSDAGAPAGGGESAAEVVSRVSEVAMGVLGEVDGLSVVVSHSGAIRALERALGVDSPPLPNLSGRWLMRQANVLTCGERLVFAMDESYRSDRL